MIDKYLLNLTEEEIELLKYSMVITKRYLNDYLPDDRYDKLESLQNRLNNPLPLQPPFSMPSPSIIPSFSHTFNGEPFRVD